MEGNLDRHLFRVNNLLFPGYLISDRSTISTALFPRLLKRPLESYELNYEKGVEQKGGKNDNEIDGPLPPEKGKRQEDRENDEHVSRDALPEPGRGHEKTA